MSSTLKKKKKQRFLPYLSDFLKITRRLEYVAIYSSVFFLRLSLSSLNSLRHQPFHTMERPRMQEFWYKL